MQNGQMKGSITVETALLMPLVLLVILTSVHLQLFWFEKAWDTAAEWEKKVTAVTEHPSAEGAVAPMEYIQTIRAVRSLSGKD